MNLTEKDKEFLEQLEPLVEKGDVAVELRTSPFKHFVLRKNYGDHIHKAFRMTRQGVRWRFQRVFNGIYVSALETISGLSTILMRPPDIGVCPSNGAG